MKPRTAALLFAILATCTANCVAGLLDKEVSFSEAEIQTALARSGRQERNYGGLMTVSLQEAPKITLGVPDERVGITARVHVSVLGNLSVPVNVTGTAGIRYNDNAKAFFLENPVAHSVESRAIPREYEPAARNAVTTLISSYFKAKPVYVLREDGPPQEVAARWLLRSIRIEPGKVVAILAPL